MTSVILVTTERYITDALSKMDVGTAAAWRATGLSQAQLDGLVRSGQLVRFRYGVYVTAAVLASAETDPCLRHGLEVAAATSRTRRGVASHHSAALMYGLGLLSTPPDGTVTLTVPPGARTGGYRRTEVIRHAAELPDEHVTKLFGVSATTAARTVADIARTSAFMAGVVVADSALHHRYASKTELNRVLARCERWPGVARARRAVAFANPLAESVFESCARVFFHEQGLPPPALQVNIIGYDGRFVARVDFCWERYRTIAEADGLLKYNDRDDAIAQLKRDHLLREAGYDVVRFTWQELFSAPPRVVARIRAAFDHAIRLSR